VVHTVQDHLAARTDTSLEEQIRVVIYTRVSTANNGKNQRCRRVNCGNMPSAENGASVDVAQKQVIDSRPILWVPHPG
jgi:hypothetical protein